MKHKTMKQWLYKSFYLLMFFLLLINFLSSQTISPIYFQIINNNKKAKAVISFLEKIKTFPEFQKILEMNKNIYGKAIEKEVFRRENDKKLLINNFEQILTKSPKARDVLYGLYQLYLAEGDKNKAREYLRKAKEVDPTIGL